MFGINNDENELALALGDTLELANDTFGRHEEDCFPLELS